MSAGDRISGERTAPREPLRLGVVGCGAVVENVYLPVLRDMDRFGVTVLVDRDEARAARLAEAHGVAEVSRDYRDLPERADAALVALPHHLHATITTELLGAGVHVLVEKPMALSTEDCDRMIGAARSSERVLAVGQIRRLFDSSRFVRHVLRSGIFGRPLDFDYREGSEYAWDVASDFMFRREAGGGVLADTGAHALDLLLWWFGEPEAVGYRDDAMGGVEADCEIELRFTSDVEGRVELSRTRNLRNSVRISLEAATLEIGTGLDPEIRVSVGDAPQELVGRVERGGDDPTSTDRLFRQQLDGFAASITAGEPPPVSGEEGRRVVALLERCRRVREPLALPWLRPDPVTPRPEAVEGSVG